MNTILDPADTWLLENDPTLAGRPARWLANQRLRLAHAQGAPLDSVPEVAGLAALDALDYEEAARREARAESAILMACSRPRDMEIIVMRLCGDGLPEIADALGMTRQGVWAALARIERAARAAVAAAMRDDGQEAAGHDDALSLCLVQDAGGQMGWAFQEVRP